MGDLRLGQWFRRGTETDRPAAGVGRGYGGWKSNCSGLLVVRADVKVGPPSAGWRGSGPSKSRWRRKA